MKTKSVAALFSLLMALVTTGRAQTVDSLPVTSLNEPYGVAVDYTDGSVYITDIAHQVLRYDPFSGDTTLIAILNAEPGGTVIYNDPVRGRGLAVTLTSDFTVVFIPLTGSDHSISLLGGASGLSASDDGAVGTSRLRSPTGLAVDGSGKLWVADLSGNIRIIDNTAAHTMSTFTNSAGALRFNRPTAVAFNASGKLYIAENRANAVKRYDPATGVLESSVTVNAPRGLLWLGGDTGLLVACDDHLIRKAYGLSPGAPVYSGVAGGDGFGIPGFVDGAIAVAEFNTPASLALDIDGQVLVADLKNNKIRRINRALAQTPIIIPDGALYTNAVSITISNTVPIRTPGSLVRFTVDGSDPTPLSPVLPPGYVIDGGPTTLKVRAYNPDFGASTMVSNVYTFAVSPIAFDVPFGLTPHSNDVTIALTSDTLGVKYYFTTDGTVPTNAAGGSTKLWTNTPPPLTGTSNKLQVIGFKDGYKPSQLLSNTFTFFVDPLDIRFPTNISNNDIQIAVVSKTEGAKLYFTTDSTSPTSTNASRIAITDPNGVYQLNRSGEFRVIGEKGGYDNSAIAVQRFTLQVGDPKIRAAVTADTKPIGVAIESITDNAIFRYTTDGTIPTPTHGVVYAGPFSLTQNGPLRVIGYRNQNGDAYDPSGVVEQIFTLTAATPVVLSSIPANSPTNVNVTVLETTPGARIRWIVNGDPLDTNNVGVGEMVVPANNRVSFTVVTNGTLSIVAVRDGFIPSAIVNVPVTLQVSNPQITLTPSASATNRITVELSSLTPGAGISYTLDGSDPHTNASRVVYTGPFQVDTNASLRVLGTNTSFLGSDVISATLNIQADAPVMTPPSGFFQDGTTISFDWARKGGAFSTDSTVYYTLDGSDPSTNSLKYTAPFQLNAVNFPSTSLRTIRARAFAAGVDPSGVRSGELSDKNKIGIQRDVTLAGSGATVYIPIIVSLKQGVTLQSLQYRVQIVRSNTAPALAADALNTISIRSNAFIRLVGNDGNTTNSVAFPPRTSSNTNDMAISFLANTSNLKLTEFGTINLISVKIPRAAPVGSEYIIRVLEASGTSDGAQTRVSFDSTVDESTRVIRVKNIGYVVGDSSPGGWYNAGDFGDGDLDNSDVNNAFYAALGARVPEAGSDVFNAMDVFPTDVDGEDFGGDQQIRFLDWNIILNRALRIDPSNWVRAWSDDVNFFDRVSHGTNLTRNASPLKEGEVLVANAAAAPTNWFRPANIEAQVRQSVEPGARVQIPVVLQVKTNYEVRGVQFVAVIESTAAGAAPALSFTPAPGLPVGFPASELPAGQVGYAWTVDSVDFKPGNSALGSISFTVPANAAPGTVYTIRFTNADGAENIRTQYDLETIRGTVIVHGTLPPNPFGRLTDEWIKRFFGTFDNLLAHADEDADGDGISNWQEYLAGTNPTELRFIRQPDWSAHVKNGFRLKFFAAVGQTYVIESADNAAGPWTQIGSGVIGDGSLKEFLDENQLDSAKFYRVRLQQ